MLDDDSAPTPADAPTDDGPSRIQQERNEHVRRRGDAVHFVPSGEQGEELLPGEQGETTEPRTFTVVRRSDESGVSGTGRVLDGCIFHNGQVVICWRGDINSETSGYASLAIYPSWEAFHKIHIAAHPENKTEVVFDRGTDLMARLVDQAAERESETQGQNDAGAEEGKAADEA